MNVRPETLAAARAVLPGHVSWLAPTLWAAIAFVISALAVALAQRAALFGSPPADVHWTERARRRWPGVHAGATFTVAAAALAAVGTLAITGPLMLPAWAVRLAAIAAAASGALAGAAVFPRRWRTHIVSTGTFLRSHAASWLLLGTGVVGLVATFVWMPQTWGPRCWLAFAAGGALTLALVAGGALWPLSALGVARPAPENLRALAEAVARDAGVPPPRVYSLDVTAANALALLVPRTLLVTRPLAELLDEEELRAVLAHEIGHLAEPRRIVWVHTLRMLVLPGLALCAPLYESRGLSAALLPVAVAVAVGLLARILVRRMELAADRAAHRAGESPRAYARALEKIYEHGLIPAVSAGAPSVHPDLWDRLAAAGVKPAWPRPEPPSPSRSRIGIAAGSVVWLVAVVLAVGARDAAGRRAWNPETATPTALALAGGGPWVTSGLAWARRASGRADDALALARLALEAGDGDPWLAADLAQLLAGLGDRDGALRAARRAGELALTRTDEAWLASEVALAHGTAGDLSGTRRWIERAERAAVRQGETGADLEARLGRAAARAGDPVEAEVRLARAVSRIAGEPWPSAHVALLCEELGRHEAAASWLERARATAGDERDALDHWVAEQRVRSGG